jgi:hypothetical protein
MIINSSNSANQNICYNNFNHIHSFYIELDTHNIELDTHNNEFITNNNPLISTAIIYKIFGIHNDICTYIFLFCVIIIMIVFYIFSYKNQNTKFLIIAITFTILTILTINHILFILFINNLSKIIKIIKIILKIVKPNLKPKLKLIVPFPNYITYPKEYSFFKELFYKPESSPFSKTQINEFYKTWNGEAIINFKWRLFGGYYYAAIWFLFTIFLICFTLASSVSSKIINTKEKEYLLILSIFFGFIHLSFEFRQFIWSPKKWILSIWNLFGMCIYYILYFHRNLLYLYLTIY